MIDEKEALEMIHEVHPDPRFSSIVDVDTSKLSDAHIQKLRDELKQTFSKSIFVPKAEILGVQIPPDDIVTEWAIDASQRALKRNENWTTKQFLDYQRTVYKYLKRWPEKSLSEIELIAEVDLETIEKCKQIAKGTYVAPTSNASIVDAMLQIFENAMKF